MRPEADPHALDYAPRQASRVTARGVTRFVLVLACVVACWYGLPWVWNRVGLMRAQSELLSGAVALAPSQDYVPSVADDAVVHKTNDSVMIKSSDLITVAGPPPVVREFYSTAFDHAPSGVVFAGSRRASDGSVRIVIVWIEPPLGPDPELTLVVSIVKPGGWITAPVGVSAFRYGPCPLPLPSGGRLIVRAGAPDPADPSRLVIPVDFAPPTMPGAAAYFPPAQAMQRAEIAIRLLNGGTAAEVIWPDEAVPDPATDKKARP